VLSLPDCVMLSHAHTHTHTYLSHTRESLTQTSRRVCVRGAQYTELKGAGAAWQRLSHAALTCHTSHATRTPHTNTAQGAHTRA
jgi:hypothetical protein